MIAVEASDATGGVSPKLLLVPGRVLVLLLLLLLSTLASMCLRLERKIESRAENRE